LKAAENLVPNVREIKNLDMGVTFSVPRVSSLDPDITKALETFYKDVKLEVVELKFKNKDEDFIKAFKTMIPKILASWFYVTKVDMSRSPTI